MPAPASVHSKICKLRIRIAGATLRAHHIANVNAFGAIDAGFGFEWKMHANWSLWVEYDHIFRRSDTLIFTDVGGGSTFDELVRRDFDKVLFGINYRFGRPGGRTLLTAAHESLESRIGFGKQKPRINRGFFYSTPEFRRLLPSRHGNRLRSMLALICGSDPGWRCEDMKRWLVSAVAALMALLPVPPPSVVARLRVPARSARRSRRCI
jgi:hypothetical protein